MKWKSGQDITPTYFSIEFGKNDYLELDRMNYKYA